MIFLFSLLGLVYKYMPLEEISEKKCYAVLLMKSW